MGAEEPPTKRSWRELPGIFVLFAGIGSQAFGDSTARLGLLYREIVEKARWVDGPTFARAYGVYTALPGPEVLELAVHFGFRRYGRLGGLVAGIGFVLPGFLIALLLAKLYLTFGHATWGVTGLLYGIRPAVIALILNGIVRLARIVFLNEYLVLVAMGAGLLGFLFAINYAFIILLLGLLYFFVRRRLRHAKPLAGGLAPLLVALTRLPQGVPLFIFFLFAINFAFIILLLGLLYFFVRRRLRHAKPLAGGLAPLLVALTRLPQGVPLFIFFLEAGLLTYGGSYTVVPFLKQGVVDKFALMTDGQFLDAIALCSLAPAPLVIVAAFVGYFKFGFLGGMEGAVGILLPAFAVTLVAPRYITRLVENPQGKDFFEAVTAAVVGVIAVTLVHLSETALVDVPSLVIAVVAFVAIQWLRLNTALAVAAAGLTGITLEALGFLG